MKVTNTKKEQNLRNNSKPSRIFSSIRKKYMLFTIMVLGNLSVALAGSGTSGTSGGGGTIDTQIGTWGGTIKSTLDAAVLVFAIVGAFLIFVQYMQGNEQAQKNLIRFVIGLAVFGLAELVAGVFISTP